MLVWYLCLLFLFLSYSWVIWNCPCMCSKEFILCKRNTTTNKCSYILSLIVLFFSFLFFQSLYLSFHHSIHRIIVSSCHRNNGNLMGFCVVKMTTFTWPLAISSAYGETRWSLGRFHHIHIMYNIHIPVPKLNTILTSCTCISSYIISYKMWFISDSN